MDIAVRCYVDNANKRKERKEIYYNKNLTFIFDCETLPDPYLPLTFGSYSVYENDRLHEIGLFYGGISPKQLRVLKTYAVSHGINLISRDEFAERFFHYVYDRRAVCVGHNLNFDLSRVATSFPTSKLEKIDNTAFSLQISADDKRRPRIYIKHLNNHLSFRRFIPAYAKNKKNKNRYPGVWVDTKTLAFALTSKNLRLEKACELFKTEYRKQKAKRFDIIDVELVSYNLADVRATFSLYQALLKRIKEYDIPAEPYQIVSPASIGPAYYRAMGIVPFMEKCKLFDKNILGYLEMAYFGGRVETRVRHVATPASYNDVASAYPGNFCRMRMWEFVVANDVVVEEDLEFKKFLENVGLEDLTDKASWASKLRGLALVRVDEDIFPIRGLYGNKVVTGIGVNYAKGAELWFSYQDIVASKLLTGGKVPYVVKAYKIVPRGVQPGLRPIQLFGNLVDPSKTDLIKYLIERRLRIKKLRESDPDNESLTNESYAAKIICNSCSYGKTVQVNVKNAHNLRVDVYGFEHFQSVVQKEERPGELSAPFLGMWATSGARLILAMAETFVKENGGRYIYMDTDAIVTSGPPGLVDKLKAFMAPLNPYSEKTDVFNIETADDGTKLDNELCFCISSKRYCWFRWNGDKIDILRASNHGLGFLLYMSKENVVEFWKDILYYHFGKLSRQDIENKYAGRYVSQQLTITSPQVLKRFKNIIGTKRKMICFNFMIVGQAYRIDPMTREPIIPVVPFTKDTDTVPYQTFFDLNTGKVYSENTEYYWKPISEVFFDFYNHKEEKFDGDVGELTRKHIQIDHIDLIGKEANDIEETVITGVRNENYVYYHKDFEQKVVQKIETLTKEEALNCGISNWQYNYIRRCLKEGRTPKFKKKTLRLLGIV
jgi:hypothetical protein